MYLLVVVRALLCLWRYTIRWFQGWYDEREEKYVTDSDAELADFKDAFGSPLKRMSEASYFFKMGK